MNDTDVVLQHGAQQAGVSLRGGRIVTYTVGGVNVVAGVQAAEGPFAYRSALLAPWPNRITGGRWSWGDRDLQLEINQPETNSALHGLVVHAGFDVVERSATSCRLVHELQPQPGYPFSLTIEAWYALDERGLRCRVAATNREDEPVPVGLGVHPYIDTAGLVDDAAMTLPAGKVLVTDEDWREVERRPVAGTDDDFRSGGSLSGREIDAAFTDLEHTPDGRVEASLRRADGAVVRVWGGAACRWLVVYTGHTLAPAERRRSMCIEPMTCGPNAFATGEVDVVDPGSTLALDWGVSLEAPVS